MSLNDKAVVHDRAETRIAVEAAPTATGWFYLTMVLAQFAVYASLGAAIAVILPASAASLAGDSKVGALSAITAIGAVGALLAQPVVGRLSDRTRWGLGRRMTWVALCGLLAAGSLFALSRADSIPALIVGVLVLQVGANGIVAMINASLPDRVPVRTRARASGALGIAIAVGATAGIIMAGFIPDHTVTWTVLAGLVLITSLLFALTNKDIPAPARAAAIAATTGEAALASGSAKPKRASSLPRSRDYWWAFASKFAVFMTYQAITSYLFFILTDHVNLAKSNPEMDVAQTVSLMSIISLISLTVVSAVGGVVADKVGRLKPFVLWAAVGFAAPGIVLIFWPTLTGLIIAQIISGASFGLYSVVDQALLTRVLPNQSNAARDLGILNIASAVPNVAAPVIAGILISGGGGYVALFIFASVCAVLGGLAIRPVRAVA